MKTVKRIMLMLSITALLCCLLSVVVFAAGSGDVAGGGEHLDGSVRADQVGGQQGGIPRHRHDSGYFLFREAGDGVF